MCVCVYTIQYIYVRRSQKQLMSGTKLVMFVSWVSKYSLLFNFLLQFVWNWYYFYLKCLVKFTNEAITTWDFLSRKVFDYKFNLLTDMILFRLPVSCWMSFGLVGVFQRICHFTQLVGFIDITFFLMISLLSFYICTVCSDILLLFLMLVIECSLFFFLSHSG